MIDLQNAESLVRHAVALYVLLGFVVGGLLGFLAGWYFGHKSGLHEGLVEGYDKAVRSHGQFLLSQKNQSGDNK